MNGAGKRRGRFCGVTCGQQHVADAALQEPARVRHVQLDRAPVQARRTQERQAALGRFCRQQHVPARASRVARGQEMLHQHARLRVAELLQRAGQARVQPTLPLGFDAAQQAIADPPVINIEQLTLTTLDRTRQLGDAQPRTQRVGITQPDDGLGNADWQRAAGYAQDLEQRTALGRQLVHAALNHRVERDQTARLVSRCRALPRRQLGDEQRQALRFFGDAPHHLRRGLRPVTQRKRREPRAVVVGQPQQLEPFDLAVHAHPLDQPQQLAQRGALAQRFGAKAADQHHCRRAGRVQHLLQQRHAVDVGPLQVVDVNHQRPVIGDCSEQATQRHESAAP